MIRMPQLEVLYGPPTLEQLRNHVHEVNWLRWQVTNEQERERRAGMVADDPTTPEQFRQRNAAIVAEMAAGATLRETGRRYGIGHERVRQIVAKHERLARWRSTVKDGDLPELKLWLARQAVAVNGEGAAPTARLLNALDHAGLDTVEALCARSEIELLRIPNFSRKCLNELKDYLKADGRSLAVHVEPRHPEPVSTAPQPFPPPGRFPPVLQVKDVVEFLRRMAVELRDRRSGLYDRELGQGAARGGHRALLGAAMAFENTFLDPWRLSADKETDPHAGA
jgi:Bacterial RNA polymerase, alpha chain C terminal domain